MKRLSGLILTAALVLAVLSGCGGQAPAQSGREQVTVALWSDQLTEHYAPYLRDRFPEVDFTFYAATNSADFYRFKQEREDLPDILTVRRFALRDVSGWKDALLDLSDTELANTYPQSYLRSYTYSDGTVNWLPACAEVDGILVNKELLERHGLALPETYQEFTELCGALTELGIRPFRSNFGADFTCMEILQGLSVQALTDQEGREWRQQYESGRTNQLSEDIWLPVFQRMADFIRGAGLGTADLTSSTIEIYTAYQNEETAMIRGTYGEAVVYGVEDRSVLLPYLGETESWYLTYPAFQIAASARGTEDPARKQLILDVMSAMLDQDGLENIENGQNIIPYSREAEMKLAPELEMMRPYVEGNRLYIRLASSDMFSVSKTVVQGMLDGTYPDARSAFDAFNAAMDAPAGGGEPDAHIGTSYPYAFTPQHGSQAASAVMNSLREELGVQLLIGPACAVAGNISAGDYTRAELNFLTMGESPSIVLCEMTGDQLYRYVDYVLTTPGIRGAAVNDSTLCVSSGFEMTVGRTETGGYALEKLTVDGRELDRAGTYSVAALGSMEMMLGDALDAAGVTDCTQWETPYKQMVAERLAEGRQLAAPTGYITLH